MRAGPPPPAPASPAAGPSPSDSECEDGRYLFAVGEGLPGDVRLTTDPDKAEVFLWQDYLNHDFMLLSLRNHRYIGKSPTTGSPYSMDFPGADPARRNGAVLHWEESH